MNNFAKKIIRVNIEDELKTSYLDYAMSVIVRRALPDVKDGLKPVHRRILYAMNKLGNFWHKPYKKSARIVGDVIGKYHPHGDNAVYDAIVRMAQFFSLRYTLIDGQGNFGSVDGDSAAAMRYTEIRMTKIAYEMLSDLEYETVNFIKNYDDSEELPAILPTKIPNLLINGATGIAVGMATNIPPHNISEVVDGCLAYLKNNEISTEELMKYIPGPDFPTAGIINGVNGIKEAYDTGRGKISIRSKAIIKIDEKSGREIIVINEIPYQVNKTKLIEKISELIKEKRIYGINNLRDESDQDGMRIVIEIKRDSSAEIVLNNLYSMTQLQVSFSINMVALHNGQPKTLTLKDIISSFINHRRDIIFKRTIFKLRKAREKIHTLEAMLIALMNIDNIIAMIKNISSIEKIKSNLMKPFKLDKNSNIYPIINNKIAKPDWLEEKYGIHDDKYFLTLDQIKIILDLRLQKLTNLEYKNIFHEYKNIILQIENFLNIINNNDILTNIIREELLFIKNEYKDYRRTKININYSEINLEDLIIPENVVVTLSHQGYVKYQPLKDYEAQRRGGKGKSAVNIKEEDFIDKLLITNTHDTILLFSSYGRVYWMKVYQLPESSSNARGKPITNLLLMEVNERITAILPVRGYDSGKYVFMATSSGKVKKIDLKEFSRPRKSGIISINLNQGDELIGVNLTNGNDEVMLFSAYGKVVRFKEYQVRNTGRTASGVRGIILSKGDKVVSLIVPKGDGQILTATRQGYGKRTLQIEYPIKSRATQGVISIKVNKRNGSVIGAVQVFDHDQIMIITDIGKLVRIRVSEVNTVGRNTQGVMLIRKTQNEYVVGLQRVLDI